MSTQRHDFRGAYLCWVRLTTGCIAGSSTSALSLRMKCHAMFALCCGFNRSTQYTEGCYGSRSVADAPAGANLLLGATEVVDVGSLAARRVAAADCRSIRSAPFRHQEVSSLLRNLIRRMGDERHPGIPIFRRISAERQEQEKSTY